jgi:hypothetical protein
VTASSFSLVEIFLALFSAHDLRSFSLIPSMGLGAWTSLIIYLQAWSESMALAPSIWWISHVSPKTYTLRVHSKSDGKSLYLGKKLFGNLFLVLM